MPEVCQAFRCFLGTHQTRISRLFFFFFLWHEPLESLKYLILQMQSEHTKTFINVYEFQTSEDTR